MVDSRPVLTEAGLHIERKMSGRVCGRLDLVCLSQSLCIDECSGCLHEGKPIFKAVSLVKGEAAFRQSPHQTEVVGLLSKIVVHEAQERGRAWYKTAADTKTVRGLEEATLETTVPAQRVMKERAPMGIVKVAIDGGCHRSRNSATHIIALDEASRFNEVREVHAHSVLECCHPRHRGQLQRHEVAKMDGGKASHEPCQGLWMAEMKWIEERVG